MLNIQQRIIDYIEQSHKIFLPGIGLIRYTYQPAELLRYTRRVLPPRYKIEFTADADGSADDFVQFLSTTEHVSLSEAHEYFNAFLSQLKEQLTTHHSYRISQLGTFRYVDKKIVFEEDKDSRLIAFNLGFKDIPLPPLESQQATQESSKPVSILVASKSATLPTAKQRSGVSVFVKIGLAIAGLILVVFFLLAQTNIAENIHLAKIYHSIEGWVTSLPWFHRTHSASIEELRKANRQALTIPTTASDSVRVATPVEGKQKVASPQLVYHIIAGSFKSLKNAEQCVADLQKLGYTPTILNFNDTLFRVSLVSYSDRQKAVDEYIRITQQHPDLKIWFYSRYE
ncbi:MAG: SPOR domain-containing protein [Bacteroidales bacterium]